MGSPAAVTLFPRAPMNGPLGHASSPGSRPDSASRPQHPPLLRPAGLLLLPPPAPSCAPPAASPSAWTPAASEEAVCLRLRLFALPPPQCQPHPPSGVSVALGWGEGEVSVTACSGSASGWAGPPGPPSDRGSAPVPRGLTKTRLPPRPADRGGPCRACPSLKPPRVRGCGSPHVPQSSSATGGGVPVREPEVQQGGSLSSRRRPWGLGHILGGWDRPPKARQGVAGFGALRL